MKSRIFKLIMIFSVVLLCVYFVDKITSENSNDSANIIIGISDFSSESCTECEVGGKFFESGCKRCNQDSMNFRIKTADNQPIITNWSNNNGMLYGDKVCGGGEKKVPDLTVKNDQTFWVEMYKKNLNYTISIFDKSDFSNEIVSISNKMCSEPTNLKFFRISMNDGKPISNGGEIIGSIDNISIYELNDDIDRKGLVGFQKITKLNQIFEENFENCETRTCNERWILQNPKMFYVDTNEQNFYFNSKISGSNDYAHFELSKPISEKEWKIRLQLHIEEIQKHPEGKGIFKIEPIERISLIGLAMILSLISLFLLFRENSFLFSIATLICGLLMTMIGIFSFFTQQLFVELLIFNKITMISIIFVIGASYQIIGIKKIYNIKKKSYR